VIDGPAIADRFAREALVWMVACVVCGFLSGSLVWWMVSTVPADVDVVDLEPCVPRAASVPDPGWGFAELRVR
jgi:hypothetical protein